MALSLSSLLQFFNPTNLTSPSGPTFTSTGSATIGDANPSAGFVTVPVISPSDTNPTLTPTGLTLTAPSVITPSTTINGSDVTTITGGDSGTSGGGSSTSGGQAVSTSGSTTQPPFIPPSTRVNLADSVAISKQIIDRQYVKNSLIPLEPETISFTNLSPMLVIDVNLKTTGGLAYSPSSFRLLPSQSQDVQLTMNPPDINVLPEGQSTIVTILQLTTTTAVFSEFTPVQSGSTTIQYEVPLGKFLEERYNGSPGARWKQPIDSIFAKEPFYRAIIDKINYHNIPSPATIRWRGYFNLEGGNYQIDILTDDGMRVYIDDILVLNEFFVQAGTRYKTQLPLVAGIHLIRIEYFNDQGNSDAEFSIAKV